MESRIISIEEANRMLPLLERIVRDIMKQWERIIYKRTELECLEKDPGEREKNEKAIQGVKRELNYLIDKINTYIKEVEDLGCFVEEIAPFLRFSLGQILTGDLGIPEAVHEQIPWKGIIEEILFHLRRNIHRQIMDALNIFLPFLLIQIALQNIPVVSFLLPA